MSSPYLLSVIETGGYAHLVPIYRKLGFGVELMPSVRKAQAWLKRNQPQVVVAEFSFDPGFRDRMSNLESLLASLHKSNANARVVVLIEKEHLPRLEAVKARYPIHCVLTFPIDTQRLEEMLGEAH
jgi:hypothetical protein